MDWVFTPFTWFQAQPALALLPASLFALLWWTVRRRGVMVAAIAWLAYAFYEFGISRGVLCGGECNIRIDLLLIAPIMWLLSLLAPALALRRQPSTD